MSTQAEIEALEAQIQELKGRLSKALAEREVEPVADYEFLTENGAVRLSELFGEHDDLLVVHNMGQSCSYCTLWADGFIGLYPQIKARCAFVLVSPDVPSVQAKIKAERSWPFPMVSDKEKVFTTQMGYLKDGNSFWPGVSAFHKQADGSMVRTNQAVFGPGDDYCAVWPFLDLLKDQADGWEPSNANRLF
ncbi:MAG: DUF899 family protein [Armatimonadetes bacterium]|nr:DUF899 family protein [Armatimonadota bacterium]